MPAVALNAGSPADNAEVGNAATSIAAISLNLNSATNTELVVYICFSANVSSITGTFGAKSLVLVGGPSTSTNCGNSYIYHVSAPATGVSTALNISWTTASDYEVAQLAFDNVGGGLVYHAASGNSATASVALATTGANDAAVAGFQNTHTGVFSASGQTGTQLLNDSSNAINGAVNWLTGTAANQVMSNGLVSDNWEAVGVAILNVAAATCPRTLLQLGVGCWAAKKLEENPILERRSLILPPRYRNGRRDH